jgi:hypothetical protein
MVMGVLFVAEHSLRQRHIDIMSTRLKATAAGRAISISYVGRCPLWVKSGNPGNEHIMSALHPKADVERHDRHVRMPTD